jgi:DNA (cytosine-5)-methyltransferase 1
MRLLDLFSGIGGFSLAASWAGIETVQFVEYDSYCQKVLNKNFPGVTIHGDIKTYRGQPGSADIISGGFPCQPFSVAGKQRGAEDDRALWSEMFRIIKEVRPSWVIGENVTGIVNMELDNVLSDLESEGYQTQAFIIPACAVDAKHRRNRVWIVAYSKSIRRNESKIQKRISPEMQIWERNKFCELSELEKMGETPNSRNERGNDGLSVEMDRLKGLGNAIVPQVAYEIFKSIV